VKNEVSIDKIANNHPKQLGKDIEEKAYNLLKIWVSLIH
jgi:hypothetical protein